MSTFIDLDSTLRDRNEYPLPTQYVVNPEHLAGFFRSARQIRAVQGNAGRRVLEFVTTIRPISITLPYVANDNEFDTTTPSRLYIDFHCNMYDDRFLISTIDAVNNDARFIATFSRIQSDRDGNPLWVHYECRMEQAVRFRRDDTMILRIFDNTGATIPITDDLPPNPPNPARQVFITFEVTPTVRDSDIDNHMVTLAQ